jgi:probable phosphoglycerate mutase
MTDDLTTTLLLIRHGMNDAVGVSLAGWEPVPLNDIGRAQADALPARLEKARIDAIYCSPLLRTRQTAGPLAAARQLDPIDMPELAEYRMGEFDGRRFDELSADPLWQRFCTLRSVTPAPAGELMIDLQARVVRGLLRVVEDHPGGTFAFVSHADPIRAAVLFFTGMPMDFFRRLDVGPASITAVALRPDGPALLKFNDTGDLHGLPNF